MAENNQVTIVDASENIPTNSGQVFKEHKTVLGNFGNDQGSLTALRSKDIETYKYVKNLLTEKYHFSELDADRFMNKLDSVGVCNYARSVNSVLAGFENHPEIYEQVFGFPMYVRTSNGELRLNDIDFLIDYYYWGNTFLEDSKLIKIIDGRSTIANEEEFINSDGDRYWPQRGGGWDELNDYIQYKNQSNIEVSLESIQLPLEEMTNSQKKDLIIDMIKNGENLSIGGNGYSLRSLDGEINMIAPGHWVKVTGVSEEGILVSSYGKECVISFDIFDMEYGMRGYVFIHDTYKIQSNN